MLRAWLNDLSVLYELINQHYQVNMRQKADYKSGPLSVLRPRRASRSCRTAFGQIVVGARCGWDFRAMGPDGTVLPMPVPWPELSPLHMAHGIGGGGRCDPGNTQGIDSN